MRDYTYEDVLKMQEDAARRVREMKRRAAIAVEEDEKEPRSVNKEKIKNEDLPREVKRISYPVEFDGQGNEQFKDEKTSQDNYNESQERKQGLLEILKKDNDAILLIGILLLLCQDEKNYPAALALLYILL